MSKPKHEPPKSLYDKDEEEAMFRDFILTRLMAVWKESVLSQRLTRGLSKDELLDIILDCAATFSATVFVESLAISEEDFREAMSVAYTEALEAWRAQGGEDDDEEEEDENEDEEDDEHPEIGSALPAAPFPKHVIDDALANPEPDPEGSVGDVP